jgi:hypothetical protein
VFSFHDLRMGHNEGMMMDEYVEALDSLSNMDGDDLMDVDELGA